MGNRKRNINVSFRVDENEKRLIDQSFKESGIDSFSAYLRTLAIDGEVTKIDFNGLDEYASQIHSIGTNVNQIAKKVNIAGGVSQLELAELQRSIAVMKWNVEQVYNRYKNLE